MDRRRRAHPKSSVCPDMDSILLGVVQRPFPIAYYWLSLLQDSVQIAGAPTTQCTVYRRQLHGILWPPASQMHELDNGDCMGHRRFSEPSVICCLPIWQIVVKPVRNLSLFKDCSWRQNEPQQGGWVEYPKEYHR